MTDLDKLIAAVEAGEWNPMAALTSLGSDSKKIDAKHAFDGSLDAAHALHKAVLPGWAWDVDTWSGAAVHPPKGVDGSWVSGSADTPARAWLLAILKAM